MTSTPYTVNDVMTKTVVTVTAAAEFKEIATAMERWKVTAVPVIEGEGHVVGVVSEADLLTKEEFHEHGPSLIEQMRRLGDTAKAGSVRAEQLMTTPAVTIRPDATLPQAARLMADRHIKRLPVVDADGTLLGIVSRADLLKVFLRADDDLAAEVRREVVDRLFPSRTVTSRSTSRTGSSPCREGPATRTSSPWPRASPGPSKVWSACTAGSKAPPLRKRHVSLTGPGPASSATRGRERAPRLRPRPELPAAATAHVPVPVRHPVCSSGRG